MPKKAHDGSRAAAVESVRWYFAEERPGAPPPKPFWLTYTGSDVVSVPGVGLFQNGTTAEVDGAIADRFRHRPDWVVASREPPSERPPVED